MSSNDKLSTFVEAVRASGLVPAADIDAIVAVPNRDGEAVARDLVRRGLLTAYQARRLWKGQGAELFLNQYVLMEKLGEGGMGEVYRARHTRLDRDVALKVMRRERLDNPEAVRRFQREIRAAATLAHVNVVLAYDADQSGEVHFFAMEYVDGATLDRYVADKGPLPADEACDYIRQAALGLQHAHEKNLIHRDVKPSNLLLDKAGVVKISDLGLVMVDDPSGPGGSRITREGLTVGTPDFLSPEQARNPRGADIRADIYALGCTFYFLLTNKVPYPDGTPTEKMLRHAREPFPTLDVSPEVAAILAKMTDKRPENRYATPAEVAAALEPLARLKVTPIPAMPRPLVEEMLTGDEFPPPKGGSETDSRFSLPQSSLDNPPKSRKTGCLSMLLLISVAVVAITLGRIG